MKDLRFLSNCTNDELKVLADMIIEKGDLTESLSKTNAYKQHPNEPHRYLTEMKEELIAFGKNGLNVLNVFGEKTYREIVYDVCKKTKTKVNKGASTEQMEQALLEKTLMDSWEKFSEQEKREILSAIGEDEKTLAGVGGMGAAGLIKIFRLGGFKSYQLAVIVANSLARMILGRGLPLVVNAGLMRALGIVAGPVGLALSVVWMAVDIAGPAYRVTVPAVTYIAALRTMYQNKHEPIDDEVWAKAMQDMKTV